MEPIIWSPDRILRFAIASVLVGFAVGGTVGVVNSVVEQLSLPSGPSFATTPVIFFFGALAGAAVGLAAGLGGAAALAFARRRIAGSGARAALVGVAAGACASPAAWGLFGQRWVIDGPTLIAVSVAAVVIAASGAVVFCERKRAAPAIR